MATMSFDADVENRRALELSALGESEEVLLRRYAAGRSPALREELIKRFMPLARSLAMRYRRQTESLDDLVQVAGLGLVKAVDGFDPARERPFPAYAVPTILGELRRHFRDHVWNVRLPRGLQERTMKLDAATNALTEDLGRFPTPTEIWPSASASRSRTCSRGSRPTTRGERSRSTPRGAPTRRTRCRRSRLIESVESGYDRVEAQLAADTAELDEREWAILRMRFVDDLTQREIAAEFDVSQMQISRISRRALWKLLSAVSGEQSVRAGAEIGSTPVRPGSRRGRATEGETENE